VKVAMASQRADLKRLTVLAKDKLRLKGIQGFYTGGGQELTEGEELPEDALVLVHRGEPFVGKVKVLPSPQPNQEPAHLAASIDSSFQRSWTAAVAATPVLRVLSFNILAPVLAQGANQTDDPESGAADVVETRTSPATQSFGVYYVPKVSGSKHGLSHNFACDPRYLSWQHRFPRLQHELLHHRPDLLCLQEMDSTAWEDCQHFLTQHGYCKGVCSQAKGGANNFVAMFWREDRFRAEQDPEIVYLKAQGTITAIIQRLHLLKAEPVTCICCNGSGQDSFGVCPLCEGERSFAETETFVAVTTHLKAGLKEKDEQDRTKQAEDLLYVLQNFLTPNERVIFTGDFNAHLEDLPFFDSSGAEISRLPGLVLPRLLQHGFRCAVREATGGRHLSFSQWCRRCDVEIRSVIDHILIRGPSLLACAALEAPDPSIVSAAGALPNQSHPSDHIPVIVDFAFENKSKWSLQPGCPAKSQGISCEALDSPSVIMSEKELLSFAQDLPQNGRVALTEDGFKYVALPKEWQAARQELLKAAAAVFPSCMPEQLDVDKAALGRQLAQRKQAVSLWDFWSPTSCVGLHISLGKHADHLDVGRRVRFQVKKLFNFMTRKLGEPSSSGGPHLFCARWFTFEVKLIDTVRCEGEEPHISFAVFGAKGLAEVE